MKLQAFNSSYFGGKRYFENDGTQNYLVFQPVLKYFKKITKSNHILPSMTLGTEDGIVEKLLLFKITFVVTFNLLIMSININGIAITNIRDVDYRC